jgi:hypothetical protein
MVLDEIAQRADAVAPAPKREGKASHWLAVQQTASRFIQARRTWSGDPSDHSTRSEVDIAWPSDPKDAPVA